MKIFFKGFLKGLGIIFLYLSIITILTLLFGEKTIETLSTSLGLIAMFLSLILVYKLTTRYKTPKVWVLVTVVFGIFILPLFLGYIETIKSKK